MKRDPNIILLSRDHHYGLLFCWKIRRGLAKHIELDRIRRYVLHFWKCNLKNHFNEEETLLFNDCAASLCLEALQQHDRLRTLVLAIKESGAWMAANYRRLADELDEHIRFEERQVFPFLEQNMTKEQLAAVGEYLGKLHTKPADDIYEDAFWN